MMLLDHFKPAPDSLLRRCANQPYRRYEVIINLLWMVWIFGDVLFGGAIDRLWVVVTAASLPVFLIFYALAYLRSQREIPYLAAAVAALGYLAMPWNHSGGTCYVIYACAFAAWCSTVRKGLAAIALIAVVFVLQAHRQSWPIAVIVSMVMVMLSVGCGNLFYRVSAQKNAELKLSHDEVRRLAATAERERIGRDLHDLLGHTLSLITLKSELTNKLFDRDVVAARREMADVERVARDALAQVRRAVTGIRAAGFAAELASAKLLLESNGVHLEYELADVAIPVDIETALAMTVREAATNIQRHARATHASIVLAQADGRLNLRIADDGRGGAIEPGNGLTGMRERLAAIGADLRVESQRDRGTALTVTLPMPQQTSLPASAELRPA